MFVLLFSLTKDDVTEQAIINVKFVKFQNVNNLTVSRLGLMIFNCLEIYDIFSLNQLFISDNQGDEETTKIQNLSLIGKPVAVTNMSEFKRVCWQAYIILLLSITPYFLLIFLSRFRENKASLTDSMHQNLLEPNLVVGKHPLVLIADEKGNVVLQQLIRVDLLHI